MSVWKQSFGLAPCLLVVFTISAQEVQPNISPPPPSADTVAPGTPSPATIQFPRTPPPPTIAPGNPVLIPSPSAAQRVLTLIPSPPGAPTLTRPQPAPETHVGPAKVKISDRTMLTGELYSDGSLPGVALFGSIAIPLTQIRGIDFQDKSNQEDQDRKAKVILTNDDSLTMTINLHTFRLKTAWGHAAIEVAKVQSVVLNVENYKWDDTPLGRALVPDDVPNVETPAK
jgi:hypothetical protein